MELELKHLKNYLGTGLKCQYTGVINGKELSAEDKRLSGLDVFDPKYKCEVSPEYGLKIGELKEIKVYKNYWTAHIGIQRRGLKTFCNGHDFKPIMLPLSAITEPLPDGSIPIVELAKIEAGNFDGDKFIVGEIGKYRYFTNRAAFNNDAHICIYKTGLGRTKQILNYNSGNGFNSYYCFRDDMADVELRVLNNQLQLFEYLYANHFDVYGFIDAGLAIDKRTVK